MGMIAFQITCLFFSLLLIGVYFSKKRIDNLENKIFEKIILVNLIGLLLDIITYFWVSNVLTENVISVVLCKLILIFLMLWLTLMTLYICLISVNNLKIYKVLKIAFIVIFLTSIIIFAFLPLNVVNLDNHFYSSGHAAEYLYFLSGLYVIVWLILMAINLKRVLTKKYYPIFAYILIGVFVIIIQYIYPWLLLMVPMETFVTFLMYFTIENPDMKLINQLELAKEQAEKANRAKTDFLSSMSHEIRTPLNAIVGFSECVIDANTLDEAKEDSKNVVMASQNLLEIVNGILDISKIEADKMEIVNKEYNLFEILDSLTKLTQVRIGEKELELKTNFATDLPPTLYGDCGKLKQVITNLLTNAVKYTESGTIDFMVNCINKKNICNLIISVSDTGRGIKPENIDKLFTKFQRLDEDKNTTTEGTGLGLAITKRLVELMGGKITVQSKYQSGSNFTVYLNQEIRTTLYKKEEVKEENVDYKKLNVLVVDDNSLNIKVAEKIFKVYGIDILGINSGIECIEMIKSGKRFDIIFMDIMMPKMDGVETLGELKKIGNFNIPVVALTADAMDGKEDKYLSSGFVSYLSKPIEREKLKEVLNKYGKIKSEEVVKEDKIDDENIKYLKDSGVNVASALELLGDMDMYNCSLNDFISVLDDRVNKISSFKDSNDMKNYAIEVHSLKSDCKYLGFDKLAEISYNHELKSKANDSIYVNENYDKLVSEIDIIKNIVINYLKKV